MSKWRRLRRGLVLVVAAGLLLYLVALVYGRVRLRRAEAAFQKTFGTLDLKSLEKPDPPRRENAAEWLQVGARAIFLADREAEHSVSMARGRAQSGWSDAQRAQYRQILDDNRCALDLLHRAASAPQSSYHIRVSRGAWARPPAIHSLHVAADLLGVEARIAIERGDVASARLALKTLARLATSLEDEPALLTTFAGSEIEHALLQLLAELAARPTAASGETELLKTAREVLPTNDLIAQARQAFGAETLVCGSMLADDAGEWGLPLSMLLRLRPFVDLTTAEVLDYNTALIRRMDAPATTPALPQTRGVARYLPHVHLASMRFFGISDHTLTRLDGLLAVRRLVEAAVVLRLAGLEGSHPETLPADLTRSGRSASAALSYTLRPDGSAVLELQSPDARIRELVLPPPRKANRR